jgi:hypothetical protein
MPSSEVEFYALQRSRILCLPAHESDKLLNDEKERNSVLRRERVSLGRKKGGEWDFYLMDTEDEAT